MESMRNRRIVDLNAIRHNVRVLRGLVPESAMLMAVVKADAYGHGSAEVARASLEAGATWLAVAMADEGVVLRKAGITAPILILGESDARDFELCAAYDITAAVSSVQDVRNRLVPGSGFSQAEDLPDNRGFRFIHSVIPVCQIITVGCACCPVCSVFKSLLQPPAAVGSDAAALILRQGSEDRQQEL